MHTLPLGSIIMSTVRAVTLSDGGHASMIPPGRNFNPLINWGLNTTIYIYIYCITDVVLTSTNSHFIQFISCSYCCSIVMSCIKNAILSVHFTGTCVGWTFYHRSVHENHRTYQTFPMARLKCLMRDLTNLSRPYKAHRTNVWWTVKFFRLHCHSLPTPPNCGSCRNMHDYQMNCRVALKTGHQDST